MSAKNEAHMFSRTALVLPSAGLTRAALAGLLATGTFGCTDEDGSNSKPLQDRDLSADELSALCESNVKKAVAEQERPSVTPESCQEHLDTVCAERVMDARNESKASSEQVSANDACQSSDLEESCADMVFLAQEKYRPLTPEEKTLNAEQKESTFAALTKDCTDRGGYVQIHAACGYQNVCRGFSYGDWGPGGATLTEHSCAGSNGCNGLSCVVLPKDEGRSGEELYSTEFAQPGPGVCTSCHAGHSDSGEVDATKFKVWVAAGSTRTADNWLDRSAAAQERLIAFGVHGVYDDGTAFQNMAPYNQVLSRAEIARVVEYIRKLDPVVVTVKSKDP